jgi:hypothetical protein
MRLAEWLSSSTHGGSFAYWIAAFAGDEKPTVQAAIIML